VVICTFISPTRVCRQQVRALFDGDGFQEIYIKCSGETAAKRDPKGLYAKAMAGEITGLTGYDGEYEEPESPDLIVESESMSVEEAVEKLLEGFKGLNYSSSE
jgi:Adenylylsulfate kinase and related kinases